MTTRIGLLGSGGQAREAAEYDLSLDVAFHAVTAEHLGARSDLVDLATRDPDLLAVPVVAAVGAPGLRRDMVARWGGTTFARILASSAWISPSASVGEGSILAPGVVLTADVELGAHVLVNVGASVSHSSRVGDFATLSPGVRIGGDCVIGAGVFLGIGASVAHGVRIADGVVVGAGAVVVHDLTEPGVYTGVPARLRRLLDGWIVRL